MTTADVRQSRANVVRVMAASMAFDQDPPVTRSLTAAKRAAEGVYDALVAAGIIAGDGSPQPAHNDDDQPLFPPNGIDPEA